MKVGNRHMLIGCISALPHPHFTHNMTKVISTVFLRILPLWRSAHCHFIGAFT